MSNPRDFAANITNYIDNLLDLVAVVMNDALPKDMPVTDRVSLQDVVATIARELRCPICSDDITLCPCEPGQNRVMYNVSRVFRTSEAQRILPLLRHQFGEEMLRQVAQQTPNYATAENWRGPQTTLLYDVEPPSRDAAVTKCRKLCHEIQHLQRDNSDLFIQSDDSGRVQWSAISIFALYFKYDTGAPLEIAEYVGKAIFPMLYPAEGISQRRYRFGYSINSDNGLTKERIMSKRLTHEEFWVNYQDMIIDFEVLNRREDEHARDLNAIAVMLDDRMDNVRTTFHDLLVDERAAFYDIAKDLLPVTMNVPTADLEYNLPYSPAKCTVCGRPFSEQTQEPATPCVGSYPASQISGEQVHMAVSYLQCANVPHGHAFCLREWARQLIVRDPNNNVTGVKAKEEWRCNTCFVDPWNAG